MFPEFRALLRGIAYFGNFLSLGKMIFHFHKLTASIDSSPNAKFDHESIFARFKAAEKTLIYGQNLTKNQENTIEHLETKGLTESQIFSLLLGRYIKPSGAIALNAKLEALLISLVLLLAAMVLWLLVGLAYDLLFHTTGAVGLRIIIWLVVAFIAVAPTVYFSLLLLRPPLAYYRHRIELAQARASIDTTPSKVINLHNRH